MQLGMLSVLINGFNQLVLITADERCWTDSIHRLKFTVIYLRNSLINLITTFSILFLTYSPCNALPKGWSKPAPDAGSVPAKFHLVKKGGARSTHLYAINYHIDWVFTRSTICHSSIVLTKLVNGEWQNHAIKLNTVVLSFHIKHVYNKSWFNSAFVLPLGPAHFCSRTSCQAQRSSSDSYTPKQHPGSNICLTHRLLHQRSRFWS